MPSFSSVEIRIQVVENGFIVGEQDRTLPSTMDSVHVFNTPSDLADHIRGWAYDVLHPAVMAAIAAAPPCPF